MTVAYAPPLTTAPARYGEVLTHEAVREGPSHIRTRNATRWHRIRSSYRRLEDDPSITQRWSFWCGQATGTYRSPILTDTPPAGEPLCGTCEGRAVGADPSRPEWLFTPWDLTRPDVCPGSRTRLIAEPVSPGQRVATCGMCQSVEPLRSWGSWHSPNWGLAAHPPADGLIGPCEFHGWREVVLVDGQAACRCHCVERSS
jgi:hypothetical protein